MIRGLRIVGNLALKEKNCNQQKEHLLDFQNAVIDLIEDNKICLDCAKIALYSILGAIFEEEFIEKPERRETIIENIEKQKEIMLQNIFGDK